jgi:hypothetical protein
MDTMNAKNSNAALSAIAPEPTSGEPVSADPASGEDVEASLEVLVPERFAITDQRSANWVVRKITEARACAQAVQEWADGEISRAVREEQFFLSRFGAQLEAWTRAQLTGLRDRKSLKLPAGTVGLRAQAQRLHVHDEAQVLEWARSACPQAIRLTVELPPLDAARLES